MSNENEGLNLLLKGAPDSWLATYITFALEAIHDEGLEALQNGSLVTRFVELRNAATDELARAGVICNAPQLNFSSETPERKGKTKNEEKQPTRAADPRSRDERARTELRAALCDMEGYELLNLWALWQAIDPNLRGCVTPVEQFIEDVAESYLVSLSPNRRGLTPDDVAEHLEKFRENFENAVWATRYFVERYRAEVSPTVAHKAAAEESI